MKEHLARRSRARPGLTSVTNVIRLIDCFSDNEYEIGISGFATRLGLAKSTVHRLAATLTYTGLLEQNSETGKYRLGLKVFELGSLVRRKMDISNEAKPWLMRLRDQSGETVRLAVLGQGGIVYINFLDSRHAIRMTSGIGLRGPVHCTAEGKSLLAYQPKEIVDRIVGLPFEQRTNHTITDPKMLRKELAAVRAAGYAIDDEECEIGMRCIAAPVRDDSGNVIAAVGVAGPVQRLTKKLLLSLAPSLLGTVQAISQRLGCPSHQESPLRFGYPSHRRPERSALGSIPEISNDR